MIETSGPTHQHASPHITDNYSFRSLRIPIVKGAPRVSDTLSGSPIFYPLLCHFIEATPLREPPFAYLSPPSCFFRSIVALVPFPARMPPICRPEPFWRAKGEWKRRNESNGEGGMT